MIINRGQIRALDAVPLAVFFDKVAAAAKAGAPEASVDAGALRALIPLHYRKAVAMGIRTERKIAAYILEQLKSGGDAGQ